MMLPSTNMDGRLHRRDQRMTSADDAYDWTTVSTLVRRIGPELDLPAITFDLLERFVKQLPDSSIEDVPAIYDMP